VTEIALFACCGARDPRWQLGAGHSQREWMLIGWRTPRSPEAGVPGEVAALLAAAFAAVARVTFPCSTEPGDAADAWVPRGSGDVRTFAPESLTGFVRGALRRAPREIVLVSTRKTESIVRLFDDEAYPWWMQGTFALLSAADGGPPDVDRQQLTALLDGPGSGDLDLVTTAVEAVVRPGVDGDLAGVLSRRPTVEDRLLAASAVECERRGIEWAVVSEEEFVTSFTE
jgi:hypothetical protein